MRCWLALLAASHAGQTLLQVYQIRLDPVDYFRIIDHDRLGFRKAGAQHLLSIIALPGQFDVLVRQLYLLDRVLRASRGAVVGAGGNDLIRLLVRREYYLTEVLNEGPSPILPVKHFNLDALVTLVLASTTSVELWLGKKLYLLFRDHFGALAAAGVSVFLGIASDFDLFFDRVLCGEAVRVKLRY